jgi:hypothetical protein
MPIDAGRGRSANLHRAGVGRPDLSLVLPGGGASGFVPVRPHPMSFALWEWETIETGSFERR